MASQPIATIGSSTATEQAGALPDKCHATLLRKAKTVVDFEAGRVNHLKIHNVRKVDEDDMGSGHRG